MKPKTPQEYLDQTEHAVRHFYADLDSCWAVYKEALTYWDISTVNQPFTPANKIALDEYSKRSRRYVDLKFSEGTFAGSILQVAARAIRYFSRNSGIPDACKDIVPPKATGAVPLCIGKALYGLPIGPIIMREETNMLIGKTHRE